MNRTRFLYRFLLAVSALLLAATASMSLFGIDSAPLIGLISLALLAALLASHLQLRMVLAGQRAGRRAAALTPPHAPANLTDGATVVAGKSDSDLEIILTGLGDVQAAVAASESFLLAELMTLRQRLRALGETEPVATSGVVTGGGDMCGSERSIPTQMGDESAGSESTSA